MEAFLEEIGDVIAEADKKFSLCSHICESKAPGRPWLMIITKYPLNPKLHGVVRAVAGRYNVVHWPLICAAGPRGGKAELLRIKNTMGGDPLPWNEWLQRAVRLVQPHDVLFLSFDSLPLPARPVRDHKGRGRQYQPFRFESLPSRAGEDDYDRFVDLWAGAFKSKWDTTIYPHFQERYLAGAARIPTSDKVDAFAVLTRKRRAAGDLEEAKAAQLPRLE
jgi:hypothetical protein